MRIVPALDEVEDGHPGPGPVSEAVLLEELAFEGGEEALAERIVVGVAAGAHRRTHPGMLAPQAPSPRNPHDPGKAHQAAHSLVVDEEALTPKLVGSALLSRVLSHEPGESKVFG